MRDISDHFVEMLHFGSADGMTMVLTHLIAIPLCAMLIAAAVAVYTVITSVVAALADGPAPLARHIITVVECETVARWNRIDRAAGAGERGPPPLFA